MTDTLVTVAREAAAPRTEVAAATGTIEAVVVSRRAEDTIGRTRP